MIPSSRPNGTFVPILEIPKIFRVVLPDGWTALSEGDKYIEVEPPGARTVEINISILPKAPKGAVSEHAARNFAQRIGAASPDQLTVVTPKQRGQQRSFLKVEVDSVHWLIACLFFKHGFVLASANTADPEDANFKLAETVLASIAPR